MLLDLKVLTHWEQGDVNKQHKYAMIRQQIFFFFIHLESVCDCACDICSASEVPGPFCRAGENQGSGGNKGQVNTWQRGWKVLVKKWQF